jgi:hypothetical protein
VLQLVAFAQFVDSDDEDFDEHLPFMAVEPRSAHKNRRGGQNRRRLNDEDALEALYTLRNELEVSFSHCGGVGTCHALSKSCIETAGGGPLAQLVNQQQGAIWLPGMSWCVTGRETDL